jgi:hypothetical protein
MPSRSLPPYRLEFGPSPRLTDVKVLTSYDPENQPESYGPFRNYRSAVHSVGDTSIYPS